MRLQLRGVIGSGTQMLDRGITDLQVAVINGTVHLYATTGRNGGIVDYTVGSTGAVQVSASVIYPAEIAGIVSDRIVLAQTPSGLSMMIGTDGARVLGYGLSASAMTGPMTLDLGVVHSQAQSGMLGNLETLVRIAGVSAPMFPGGFRCDTIVELAEVTVSGRAMVLAACQANNGVTAFVRDPGTGALTETGHAGAATGLGIHAPTAMEIITMGGQTFAVLAASTTSSVSVMRILSDGSLMPTDHVIDTGGTRFEGVQALATAVVGDRVFIAAGGADNGITLFTMLPDGALVALQTFADTESVSLHRVTSLTMTASNGLLHLFAGSQNDTGLTHFSLSLTNLGVIERGTLAPEILAGSVKSDILMAEGHGDTLSGSGGEDILVSGIGLTTMTGGNGADIFVVRADAGRVVITDFNPLMDRLDLADLPMLRSTGQIALTTTASGAVLTVRGVTIEMTASNGAPLRMADLFPGGFEWADRIPLAPAPVPEVGLNLTGTNASERLYGSDFNDTLRGGAGNDSLYGAAGDDRIEGGAGHDRIVAEAGNNTLLGGAGRDRIFAGAGNDTIQGNGGRDVIDGGAGNDWLLGGLSPDTITGGAGNDTIDCGDGNDSVIAGDGDDLVYGVSGRNRIALNWGDDTAHGGIDADHIDGGEGNDLIHGMAGDDTLIGWNGNDSLFGGDGADWLSGGAGNDVLQGDNGNDSLFGADGDDWLSGGSGNDLVNGGAGNDLLRGGPGSDTLIGGAGADLFEFFRDHEVNRIRDFNPADGDRLRLDDWIWNSFGTLTAQQVVDRYALRDADGNVVLDFSQIGGCLITLEGFSDLGGLAPQIDLF